MMCVLTGIGDGASSQMARMYLPIPTLAFLALPRDLNKSSSNLPNLSLLPLSFLAFHPPLHPIQASIPSLGWKPTIFVF